MASTAIVETGLKRRLIFGPLPEPEPLHTYNRVPLPDRPPDMPLLDWRPLLQPGYLLHPEVL